MRAAVFEQAGKNLAIREVSDPTPDPARLVVKVGACGICGSDLDCTRPNTGTPIKSGTILGHEFSGEVHEVGSQLKGQWKTGDRVCVVPRIACGECEYCKRDTSLHCELHRPLGFSELPGAYAEYVQVGGYETVGLPDSVSMREGALVEPISVALRAVNKSNMAKGDNVLIVGAGPIGLAISQWCRFFGARNIVVADKLENRLNLSKGFGATDVINVTTEPDLSRRYRLITGNHPDIVYEAAGGPGMIQQCIDISGPEKRLVVVGVCSTSDFIKPVIALYKELLVQFVFGYGKHDFQYTVDMLDQEKIAAQGMITDVVDLDGLPQEFERLRKPTTQCKVIVEP